MLVDSRRLLLMRRMRMVIVPEVLDCCGGALRLRAMSFHS
jgi:hypothetical protein